MHYGRISVIITSILLPDLYVLLCTDDLRFPFFFLSNCCQGEFEDAGVRIDFWIDRWLLGR